MRISIDLVGSKGLPVLSYRWILRHFNINNSRKAASRVQGFKDGSAYSKVRQRLREIQEVPKVDELILEVQGRLAWEKVKKNYKVYILLP